WNTDTERHDMTVWLFDEESFVPMAMIKEGRSYSILTDQLGTPTEAYDADGNEVWSRMLDMDGNVIEETGNKGMVPFLFQGQYYDRETGLAYNRFRYYSPQMSMYISQDPIGLAGGILNLYGYVHDTNYWVDVLGLSSSGYAKRFFDANPKMKKFIGKLKIEIHHRIPQMYIGTGRLFPEAMRTSLSNLQGLPRKIHREVVSPAWTAFRKANPTPTRAEVIQQAMRIDKQVAEHIGRIN
ncbi:RHS repeat domain-containing protein, partial [Parabacteroides sp. 2_1_7]